jgi:hypothetical protein
MHTSNKSMKESKVEQALKAAAEAYKTKVLNEIKAVRLVEADWKPGYGMIAEDAFLVGAYWLLENSSNFVSSSQPVEKPSAPDKEWEDALNFWGPSKKQETKDE